MTDQIIAKGYKQTEVGVIPDDWQVVKIESVFDFIKTYSNPRSDLSNIGDIEYLHYGDIHTKYKYHLDFNKNILPKISFKKLKSKIEYAKNGDLFIADASEDYEGVGKSIEVVNLHDKKVISGLHTFLLRDSGNNFVNIYKGFILCNKNVSRAIKVIATGSKVLGISKTNLAKLKIPLPPKSEQQKIADILTTWDEAIEKQTDLIQQKQQLKKGLMQQLLTGKTRFSEFDDDWQVVKLRDILIISTGTSKSKYIGVGNNYIVDMGSISKYGKLQVSKKTNYANCFLKYGDLVMPKDDIGGGNIIGKVAFIDCDNKYVFGDHIFRLESKGDDSLFLSYLINGFEVNKELKRKVTGSAQLGLNKKNVENEKINIPSIKEQQKIAQVLSLADDEITQLQNELALLKTQKQGLMQQLLTGQVRVKV